MKKTKQEQFYNIDEVEDLTLFANESFDTQDVDLFEFSSEESSPLVRLKSIILSLDWEISDETLQELANELPNLQATWQGDKVAEVYLQGLEKIGRYIRNKGAYAHPNSIKLLLTFFYNFEKIVSSEHLSGDEITKILKGDIRKFKILQYQINQLESAGEPESAPVHTADAIVSQGISDSADSDKSPLKLLRAAILSLDWEVTDDNLKQFNEWLQQYRTSIADNRLVMVLVQGLQALGEYIGTERADAHPEAFTLLHSFSDALDQVARFSEGDIDEKRAQDILVEQINRLNNLKLIIARPQEAHIDEQAIEEVMGEINRPTATEGILEEPVVEPPTVAAPAPPPPLPSAVEQMPIPADDETSEDALQAELDSLFGIDAKPAMESADTQYPNEILPPDAIQPVDDELADDLIEASLHSKRGLMPALSNVDDTAEVHETNEPLDNSVQVDLNQQLDMLFAEVEMGESALSTPDQDLGDQFPGEVVDEPPAPILAGGPVADETNDDEEEEWSDSTASGAMVVAALSDAEEPEDRIEPAAAHTGTDEEMANITSKLDSFFDFDSDKEDEAATTLPAVPAREDDAVAALSDAGDTIAENLAVADAEPEAESLVSLESKLDDYFQEDSIGAQEEPIASVVETSADEAEELLYFATDQPMETALAECEEDKGFSEEEANAAFEFTPLEEIEEKLDFFFDTESEGNQADISEPASPETVVDEKAPATVPVDLFADMGQDHEEDIVPALAAIDDDTPIAEEVMPSEAGGEDGQGKEIEQKLDVFFTDEAKTTPIAAVGEETVPADDLLTAIGQTEPEDRRSVEALDVVLAEDLDRDSGMDEILGLEQEMPVLTSDLFAEIEGEEAIDTSVNAGLGTAEDLDSTAQVKEVEGIGQGLEGELDLFFADEAKASEPVTEPETISELTRALEATIDNAEENEVLLASIGSLLPSVVRTPARKPIDEALHLLDSLQRQAVLSEHRSLAGLLNSTVSLLGRTAGKDKTETEKLINYLYEQLLRKEVGPDILPEAVNRFTGWMRSLCATMPMIPERRGEAEEPRFEYTAKELYFELAELRASIRDELAKLRHEMHHRS